MTFPLWCTRSTRTARILISFTLLSVAILAPCRMAHAQAATAEPSKTIASRLQPFVDSHSLAGAVTLEEHTWRIRFNMDQDLKGTATLRLAICVARGGPVDVGANGRSIGGTGELFESGVMHRDGIRADSLTERNLKFDASLLKAGENVISLTKHVHAWTDGVLYDYIRLELEEKGQ
jgi:hypothetical protein